MIISDYIGCQGFPCRDVRHECYQIPAVDVDPQRVSIIMISEAVPPDPGDDYYAPGNPLFARTTLQAFQDAGAPVASLQDVLALGVYVTSAVKCAKTAYGIQTATITECSHILQAELALFPAVQVYLLMGDVAIRSLNYISKRQGLGRVIPAGSTYKIRGGTFHYQGARAFPSYLQAGPSFFIEKSKRRMIAEDIASALRLVA